MVSMDDVYIIKCKVVPFHPRFGLNAQKIETSWNLAGRLGASEGLLARTRSALMGTRHTTVLDEKRKKNDFGLFCTTNIYLSLRFHCDVCPSPYTQRDTQEGWSQPSPTLKRYNNSKLLCKIVHPTTKRLRPPSTTALYTTRPPTKSLPPTKNIVLNHTRFVGITVTYFHHIILLRTSYSSPIHSPVIYNHHHNVYTVDATFFASFTISINCSKHASPSWGPGDASGWYWMEMARLEGIANPAHVPSFKLMCVTCGG